MSSIGSVIIEAPDPAGAIRFYAAAFGVDDRVSVRAAGSSSTGFRGFTLSFVVSQPSTVDGFVDSAIEAGATVLKPVSKSFWGYGGVVQAPDGTICTLASASKKDTGPASRQLDEFVLQLGVADVVASKQFYVERGLTVAKSFGRTYVQFESAAGSIALALYKRSGLAKTAGVPLEGSGSHRLAVVSEVGPFTDPDGFAWETEGSAA